LLFGTPKRCIPLLGACDGRVFSIAEFRDPLAPPPAGAGSPKRLQPPDAPFWLGRAACGAAGDGLETCERPPAAAAGRLLGASAARFTAAGAPMARCCWLNGIRCAAAGC
jgi:hypothetical protein